MIDRIIQLIQNYGASDVHVSSGRRPYLRVSGELVEMISEPVMSPEDVIRLLVEFVGEEKAKRVINRQEIDFSFLGAQIRVRGHAYVRSGHIAIALRVIEKIRPLAELNIPETLYRITERKQGFFLIVGPVGQGKSTTMAALLDHINETRKDHIVTIEHPIEYVFEPKQSVIDQREVELDTDSFSSALRSVFREDANVIMLGEMRDLETISTAVTAAETGHLVFSTLHTNSASQTIDRIIDSFPPNQQNQIRSQLSTSLVGIFSQRLIPSLRGGRVPAYELLLNNSASANLIREGRVHEIETVLQTHREEGMIDLNTSLVELVRQGHVAVDDAIRHSNDPKGLALLVGGGQ